MTTFHTYRCTGVCIDGTVHLTDLSGFEAEYLADGWIRKAIEGERYVLARITVLNDKGSVMDVRREWFKNRRGAILQ